MRYRLGTLINNKQSIALAPNPSKLVVATPAQDARTNKSANLPRKALIQIFLS